MIPSVRQPLRLVAVVVLTVLVGFAAPVAAQDEGTVISDLDQQIQILSSSVDDDGVAELIVAIPPSMGEVSPEAGNFALLQGGQRRALRIEEVRDEVDVVLVIDTSGSMRGAPLAAAKSAANGFVRQMPEEARIAVVGFGAEPSLKSELTTDRATSEESIQSLTAGGETALWDAMSVAGELVAKEGRSASYVVLLSDGGDTASATTPDRAVDALTEAQVAGLYAVTLQTAESDHSALIDASEQIGGQVLTTQSTETIEQLYLEIAGRLQSRYSVRFLLGQGEVAVLSVAIDDAVATARTSLGELGVSDDVAPARQDEVAPTLNGFVEPQLGTVVVADPDVLGQSYMIWLGSAAVFGALAVLFSFFAVPAMKVQSLGSGAAALDARSHVGDLNQRLSGAADRLIKRRDESGALDRSLDAANLELRAGEFTVLLLVALIGAGAVGSLLIGMVGAVVMIFLLAAIAVLFVRVRIGRRRKAFAEQLQNTINILVGSLRAGRGLPQALEMVAQEAPAPTSEEFRRVIVESRVGRDPIASLEAVATRMDNQDLEWIAQAIAINRELGGDLIELLQNVAGMVRERSRIALKVRALSAEGRMSGWVMLALPVLLVLYMRAVNPEYIETLYTTSAGVIMSIAGTSALLAGAIWIRNLVNIEF